MPAIKFSNHAEALRVIWRMLEDAGRQGEAHDTPEGARFITLSDTLATQLSGAIFEALTNPAESERYFMSRDHDGHWYVIPVSRKAEWDAWLDLPDHDERAWDAPDWVAKVGGSYTLVTFCDPKIGD